jgi:hypothetical protein
MYILEAGDDLFRVVERTPLQSCQCGGERVEVISRAPVRVLAWKIWTTSRVEVTKCNFGCSMNRCAADGHNKPSRSGKHGIISTRVITFELRSSVRNGIQMPQGIYLTKPEFYLMHGMQKFLKKSVKSLDSCPLSLLLFANAECAAQPPRLLDAAPRAPAS